MAKEKIATDEERSGNANTKNATVRSFAFGHRLVLVDFATCAASAFALARANLDSGSASMLEIGLTSHISPPQSRVKIRETLEHKATSARRTSIAIGRVLPEGVRKSLIDCKQARLPTLSTA